MLKVGVIDTGVNVDQLEIDSSRVKGIHLFKDTSTGEIQAGYDLHDDLLHGTVCLHILHSCGADIEFFVVKIFDTVAQASVDILVRAIEECIAQNVNVINISLGIQTEKMPFTLQKACDKARSRGILIVAAAHNNSLISYPAHSPSVIGVGHLLLEKDSQIVHFRDYPIDFFLTGMHFFRGSIFSGSSFACPKLTGIVLKLLADSAGRVNGDIKEAHGCPLF
jgi:subtilisin family serine protease